jgi:sugar lactone lactonase YvrE
MKPSRTHTFAIDRRRLLMTVPAAAVLSACGGGGGDDEPAPVNPPTQPPTAAPQLSLLAGSLGDEGNLDGPATLSRLNNPGGVAIDAAGTIFIADSGNHTVRKLDAAGVLSTLAGQAGALGSADGVGAQARFRFPRAVAVDGAGGVFVADSGNHTIRHVDAQGAVRTVAGAAGVAGEPGAAVDVPVPGPQARFSSPMGLAFDGQFLYVADNNNNGIRRIDASGNVTLHAGSADGSRGAAVMSASRAAARFNRPHSLALDSKGALWVSDQGNNAVRRVFDTVVNFAQGLGTGTPPITAPKGLTVERATDTVFVMCAGNQVLHVQPIETVANIDALNAANFGDADGPFGSEPDNASFNAHLGEFTVLGGALCMDEANGRLLVADLGNSLIRAITLNAKPRVVSTLAGQRLALAGATNGAGAAARFNAPVHLTRANDGGVLVAQAQGSKTVRHLTLDGAVTDAAVVGNASANLSLASSAAQAPNGDLYIAGGERISVARNGTTQTLVAPVAFGPFVDGPSGVARIGFVSAMTVDAQGNAVIADTAARAVRRISPAGSVSRIAGRYGERGSQTGDALDEALLDTPVAVVAAPDGSLLVLDAGNRNIVRIARNAAGRDEVQLVAANFNDPRALALDAAGNLYVAEGTLQTILRITPAGERKTVVGRDGVRGFQPGALPGALALPFFDEEVEAAGNRVGLLVVGDRLLLTMEQAVVQITPLPQ